MWVKCDVSSRKSRSQSGIIGVLRVEGIVPLGRVALEFSP